jgi:RimJ/RimL family protein N-acetyltransferase
MPKMIKLKEFQKSDIEQLCSWVSNATPEFVMQWAGPSLEYPVTIERLNRYLIDSSKSESYMYIFKALNENNNAIGHISLGKIDHQKHSARIGRVLVGEKNARGNGYGEMMVNEVVKFGFKQLNLYSICLGVFDFNSSAIRCYEKCGFVKTEVLPEYRKVGREYWNLVEMRILKRDWEKIGG